MNDPEVQAQHDELADQPRWFLFLMLPGWCVTGLFYWWPREAWHWVKWKRVCSWCGDRLGGNPVARRITHGMCAACARQWQKELNFHEPATGESEHLQRASAAARHPANNTAPPPPSQHKSRLAGS